MKLSKRLLKEIEYLYECHGEVLDVSCDGIRVEVPKEYCSDVLLYSIVKFKGIAINEYEANVELFHDNIHIDKNICCGNDVRNELNRLNNRTKSKKQKNVEFTDNGCPWCKYEMDLLKNHNKEV